MICASTLAARKNVWINNCLALGLCSSFLEPLEATSIHGTIVQLMVFTNFHLGRTANDREAYNAFAARQVDDFRDFINMHYVTERRDTPFWQHVADSFIAPATKERLLTWQAKMPEFADFNAICRAASPIRNNSSTTLCLTGSACSTAPQRRNTWKPGLNCANAPKPRQTV